MEYSHDQAASTSKWLSKSMFLSLAQNKQGRRQALALWRSNKLSKSVLLCLKKEKKKKKKRLQGFYVRLTWSSLTNVSAGMAHTEEFFF